MKGEDEAFAGSRSEHSQVRTVRWNATRKHGATNNMTKRFLSNTDARLMLGAGVMMSGVSQPKGGDTTAQTAITILVLVAVGLPVLMAVFGYVVLRVLGWLTRSETQEDEVVYPAPTLPPGVHLPDPTIWPAVLAFGLMGLMFAIALQSWIVLGVAALFIVLGLLGWIRLEVKEFRSGSKRKA